MVIVAALLLCGGCVSQHSQVSEFQPSYVAQTDSPALALAYDPAVTLNQPALYLDREPRQPAAFAGYDQQTVTYSDVITDDFYQSQHGQFNRDAITERVNVSTR